MHCFLLSCAVWADLQGISETVCQNSSPRANSHAGSMPRCGLMLNWSAVFSDARLGTAGISDYCNTLHNTTPNGPELRESLLCDCLFPSHCPGSVRAVYSQGLGNHSPHFRAAKGGKGETRKHRLQSVSDVPITDAYLVEASGYQRRIYHQHCINTHAQILFL